LQTRANWGSSSKVQQALRAVSTTDCLNPSNGCVPLNLFGAEGSITPAMMKFINLDAILLQKVEQKVLSGSVSGDLGAFKSPGKKSINVPWRRVSQDDRANKSDSATQIQEFLEPAPLDSIGTVEGVLRKRYSAARKYPLARNLYSEAVIAKPISRLRISKDYAPKGWYRLGAGLWLPGSCHEAKATRAPGISPGVRPASFIAG
jgi:hypothetical protein